MHLRDNSEPKAIFIDIKWEDNDSLHAVLILFTYCQYERTQHI